jgi:hypothetical protein
LFNLGKENEYKIQNKIFFIVYLSGIEPISCLMKKLVLSIFVSAIIMQAFSRPDTVLFETDKPFRIEIEPSSYIAKGWSLLASYGITKDNNLHVGVYTISSTLPSGLNERMFHNVTSNDKIRLTFEIASSIRYKIPYNMKGESNPYIGLFFGWESFEHTAYQSQIITKLSNYFLTPQIGYEIYIYRQMVYLNPSIRIVYEFGKKSNYVILQDAPDAEPEISTWLWLPSFSIGIRL